MWRGKTAPLSLRSKPTGCPAGLKARCAASPWCKPARAWANRRPTRPPSSRWPSRNKSASSFPPPPWRCKSSSSPKTCRPSRRHCHTRLRSPWPRVVGATSAVSNSSNSPPPTPMGWICSTPTWSAHPTRPAASATASAARSAALCTSVGAPIWTPGIGTVTATVWPNRPVASGGPRWPPSATPAPRATAPPTTAAAITKPARACRKRKSSWSTTTCCCPPWACVPCQHRTTVTSSSTRPTT